MNEFHPSETSQNENRIQKSLNERLSEIQNQADKEIIVLVKEQTAMLLEEGTVERAIKKEDNMPSFNLPDQVGSMVYSDDLLKKGNIILSFYRGAWCPFCQEELRELQIYLPEFRKRNTSLVAISPQTPDNSLTMAQKIMLEYKILSDQGNNIANKFGIVFKVPDSYLIKIKTMGVDMAKFNGDSSNKLPIPATYVVDTTGKIRFSYIDPDCTKRCEPEEILKALDSLQ